MDLKIGEIAISGTAQEVSRVVAALLQHDRLWDLAHPEFSALQEPEEEQGGPAHQGADMPPALAMTDPTTSHIISTPVLTVDEADEMTDPESRLSERIGFVLKEVTMRYGERPTPVQVSFPRTWVDTYPYWQTLRQVTYKNEEIPVVLHEEPKAVALFVVRY